MTTTPITPNPCPKPDKMKFDNRAAAENFERNHREQNGQQSIYECACGKLHLTSTGSDRIAGGPSTPNSSSWMSSSTVAKQPTHAEKIKACLIRFGGSRTAKEIAAECGGDIQLVYTVSKACGIPFLRGGPQVSYGSGIQTLSGIAARKQQMLEDMATLEAQEAKLTLEVEEQKKCKVRMSDLNDGNVVVSASQRELRLTPQQYQQLVTAVKTFVVVPVAVVPKAA
jgi:hypothetical protein